jgi:hypothetical protein
MVKSILLLTLPVAVTLISGTAVTPSDVVIPPQPVAADAKIPKLVDAKGAIDRQAYVKVSQLWGPLSMNERLGPTFELLNPNATDDRPTLFRPTSHPCEKLSFANRTNPYELGKSGCRPDDDYWSESGQVGYIPDDPANDPGLDRIQVYAYYNHVFALSPRLDYASGKPHPDPQTRENDYKRLLGHFPQHPVAMVRSYGMLQNEALVVYREGLLGVAGTQTSREGYERPYPGIMLPKNKVPTGLAITASNEFALVTVWDVDALKGQLAVVALEAKYLPFHTWPYMALPNQGSFSDMKLLGFVDLPMAAPSAVAASSNGWWGGPSQTGNKVLSQIDLKDDGVRKELYSGDVGMAMIVANKGYAIVASKDENKVAVVDLSPLFKYVRESYLSSQRSFDATLQGRADKSWPATFDERPEIKPRVVWETKIDSPTAVLAGIRIDRWSQDRYKAYVASEDGTIHIVDASSQMARWDWEKSESLKVMGTFKVGRNPVSMVFARYGESTLPLIPNGQDGKQLGSDPINNLFYVACRGDREVCGVVTWEGKGAVYRRIKDKRLNDPVALNVASRGNILSVADFNGRKIVSFRIGPIIDRYGVFYGAGEDGKADFEYAGDLPLPGKPFLVSSANVN